MLATCNVASGWDPGKEKGHQQKTDEMLNQVCSFIHSDVPMSFSHLGKCTRVVWDSDIGEDWVKGIQGFSVLSLPL